MRKFIVFIGFLLLWGGTVCAQDRTITITGDLSPLKNQWNNIDGDSLTMIFFKDYEKTDTVSFLDYRFFYTGDVDSEYVTQAYLMVNGPDGEQIMILPVFVEPGEVSVWVRELPEEEMFNIEVTGTPNNDLWSNRIARYVDLNYEMVDISRDSTYTNDEKMDVIYGMMEQQDSLIRNFYRDNRDSEIAPVLALQRYYRMNDFLELAAEIEYLRPRFEDHPDFHSLETTFWMMPGLQPGDTLPDVTLTDINGKKRTLKELVTDAYLLLDFWSSVSGPSMADFSALKKLPTHYNGKPLHRIGISTDLSRAVWLTSLKKQKPPGIQLWDDELNASRQFHLTTYPVRFLIAPEGTIIARGNFTSLDNIESTIEEPEIPVWD